MRERSSKKRNFFFYRLSKKKKKKFPRVGNQKKKKMSGRVEWRNWNSSSVPYIYYQRDLADWESRNILKKTLCKSWAARNVSIDVMKDAVKRISFVTFNRIVEKKEDTISPYSFIAIKTSDRVTALSTIKSPIYCIGCADKIMKGKGNNTIVETRITMLGFISESSDAISYGVKTSKGQRIGGIIMNESFLAILISVTTLDLVAELKSIEDSSSIVMAPKMREEPTSYVYVFGWDPPTRENVNDLIKLPLEQLTIDRVNLLCNLYEGKRAVVRPLTSKEENLASKSTIHLLVMLICWSPELCEWFVDSEDLLLTKRLALLCDHEDILITMEAARIRPEADQEVQNIMDDSEKIIRDVQQRRLRTALKYAQKRGSLPDMFRELASKIVLIINSKIRK